MILNELCPLLGFLSGQLWWVCCPIKCCCRTSMTFCWRSLWRALGVLRPRNGSHRSLSPDLLAFCVTYPCKTWPSSSTFCWTLTAQHAISIHGPASSIFSWRSQGCVGLPTSTDSLPWVSTFTFRCFFRLGVYISMFRVCFLYTFVFWFYKCSRDPKNVNIASHKKKIIIASYNCELRISLAH